MNAVKTGWFSHNYEVAQWWIRFLTKLAYEFEGTECVDGLYDWVNLIILILYFCDQNFIIF